MKKLIPLFVTAIIGTIVAYGMWELTSSTHPKTDLGESKKGKNVRKSSPMFGLRN